MSFTLPSLPYNYNALEPHFDARTMEIHHTKHHQAYVDNLNKAIDGTEYASKSIEEIMANISKLSTAVRNNGGGHYNHSLFWQILSPNGKKLREGALANAIANDLGGMEKLKADFAAAGMTRFGSGWAWICVDANKKLCVCSTPNQDNPLMDIADCKGTPILGMDVWEHAFLLDYAPADRPKYIEAFFQNIDWDAVNARLNLA